jgi:hypothetical protein
VAQQSGNTLIKKKLYSSCWHIHTEVSQSVSKFTLYNMLKHYFCKYNIDRDTLFWGSYSLSFICGHIGLCAFNYSSWPILHYVLPLSVCLSLHHVYIKWFFLCSLFCPPPFFLTHKSHSLCLKCTFPYEYVWIKMFLFSK